MASKGHKKRSGKGSNSSKQNSRLSRRALIGRLGSGLALTALGGAPLMTAQEVKTFPPPPTIRSQTPPQDFTASKLSEIHVLSCDMTVVFENKTYAIQGPFQVDFDLTNGKVSYRCLSLAALTPEAKAKS